MKVLELVNAYIRYVYLIMIVVLVIVVIRLLSKMKRLSEEMEPVNESTAHLSAMMDELNEKKAIIDNTRKNSVPFFMMLFFGLSIIWLALKDYFRTKYSRKDFSESLGRAYKYKTAMRELRMLKRASGR
ncbi:MAG: hypothetical protein IJJ00_07045 [Erysipelotrichaceae bacterium]|nr:hypothetical protein [Erysipelotrichaceae bacterium]